MRHLVLARLFVPLVFFIFGVMTWRIFTYDWEGQLPKSGSKEAIASPVPGLTSELPDTAVTSVSELPNPSASASPVSESPENPVELQPAHQPKDHRPTMKVGFYQDPPWKVAMDQQVGGVDALVAWEVARRLDLGVQFVPCLPPNGCRKKLSKGSIDVLIRLPQEADLGEDGYLVSPKVPESVSLKFYKLATSPDQIPQYSDLRGRKIGYLKRMPPFRQLERDPAIKKYGFNRPGELMEALQNRKVNLIVGQKIRLEYLMHVLGLADKVVATEYEIRQTRQVYLLALSKASPLARRLDEFQQVVASLNLEGASQRFIGQIEAQVRLP